VKILLEISEHMTYKTQKILSLLQSVLGGKVSVLVPVILGKKKLCMCMCPIQNSSKIVDKTEILLTVANAP
jgi:hypothetical protein